MFYIGHPIKRWVPRHMFARQIVFFGKRRNCWSRCRIRSIHLYNTWGLQVVKLQSTEFVRHDWLTTMNHLGIVSALFCNDLA